MAVTNSVRAAVLAGVLIFSCGSREPAPEINSFTCNGEAVPPGVTDYRILNGTVYLAASTLEQCLKLELKILVPDVQIGICTEDLCIAFPLDRDDRNAAFFEDGAYYIPVKRLMEQLGGAALWDPAQKSLAVTLAPAKTGLRLDGMDGSPEQD